MRWKIFEFIVVAVCLTGCSSPRPKPAAPAPKDPLKEFKSRAAQYNSVVSVPSFETTSNELQQTLTNAIVAGNAALDRIGMLAPAEVTFNNTVRALDDLGFRLGLVANRLSLLEQTSTNANVRDVATDTLKELNKWMVGIDYREDVYKAVKAYADSKPKLAGEEAKLLFETMRDYRRAGLELSKAERDEVERLRKELTGLETDFGNNVTKAERAIKFTKTELDGVPDDFLQQTKTGDDEYTVSANIRWHYFTVMENAKREDVRKKLQVVHDNLVREKNISLLERILPLRDNIARKLGYKNWADYVTEVRMAKTGATAIDFLEKLKTGLELKYDSELREFHELKVKETGDTNADVHVWDWRYYANQLKKQRYDVDAEQLRVYFPYQRVLDGMFAIYQRIFGLKFEQVEPPYKWIGDLQLYTVSDTKTREPLGLFYLDMFPREGKYNHFAEFGLIDGKLLPDGKYQRPTVALICNFPAPAKDHPSLMSHDDVVTIFHEFGHAMHSILTRAKYVRFAGTSVPQDFVEAPSQMLENWAWDKRVLDSFAADYRDPSKKIPAEVLAKLKESRLAIEGTYYRRQLSFGLMDLALHTRIHDDNAQETLPLSNEVMGEVFLPRLQDTAFVAYFGHIIEYGAGYYGYAWADAIAADMGTVFEKSSDGYFDQSAGMKLRREIYEVGDSRDVNISIEKFLGRTRSLEPFLKRIGVTKDSPPGNKE